MSATEDAAVRAADVRTQLARSRAVLVVADLVFTVLALPASAFVLLFVISGVNDHAPSDVFVGFGLAGGIFIARAPLVLLRDRVAKLDAELTRLRCV